ncbi:Ribonuclease HII [Porphyridium purpureum]|uniref:Ribonuclease n=1 Tax=Porphyridium purpureum TaxID=35688 RepID=A0A5J4Z2K7_PORPP|nr:Ribonuclease HII [Porphyridium purpureum]|eukprot:POR0038..scf295_1
MDKTFYASISDWERESLEQRRMERELLNAGYSRVLGIDEAGRGCLAGPVVAACAYLPLEISIERLKDSKLVTSEAEREKLFQQLCQTPGVIFAHHVVHHEFIDEHNILQATFEAMRRATQSLLDLQTVFNENETIVSCIDGNQVPPDFPTSARAITKGDRSVLCISAASIVAKVLRDRIMVNLDAKYPGYGFAKHKGYATAVHRAKLVEMGPCPIHRRSYQPVRLALEASLSRTDVA